MRVKTKNGEKHKMIEAIEEGMAQQNGQGTKDAYQKEGQEGWDKR